MPAEMLFLWRITLQNVVDVFGVPVDAVLVIQRRVAIAAAVLSDQNRRVTVRVLDVHKQFTQSPWNHLQPIRARSVPGKMLV